MNACSRTTFSRECGKGFFTDGELIIISQISDDGGCPSKSWRNHRDALLCFALELCCA